MKKIIFLFLFLNAVVIAQVGKIKGVVTDENNVPLIGANVILLGTDYGAASNRFGKFSIEKIKEGLYVLKVSNIGYEDYFKRNIRIKGREITLKIKLRKKTLQFDPVVITASKYSQKLSDLPESVSLINSRTLSEKNFTSIDEALRYTAGVYLIEDQISIRGSNGYSRGAGARVLTAIDGIPIYAEDTGEIIWQLIPINEVHRIEIIKGAGSSIYGSSSMGGVVNVITKKPSRRMITFIKSYVGFYGKPYYSRWNWTNQIRGFNGQTIASSKATSKFAYSVSLTRNEDLSYRQNDWYKRYGGYLNLNYNVGKMGKFTFITLAFKQNRGTFNFWKDSRNALVPPEKDEGQTVNSQRYLFALKYSNNINPNLKLNVTGSFLRSIWKDQSESNNNSASNLFRTELRSIYSVNSKVRLITGIELIQGNVKSNIFGSPTSSGYGIYSQLEYRFGFPLIITAGARYDNMKLDTLDAFGAFSPKVGLVYKLKNSINVRANISMGFRAPTLAEAFTTTVTSGIVIKANPELKPETNYSFELGVNKKFGEYLNFDVALFQSEFKNLIEPQVDVRDGKIFFNNLTRARIQGVEVNTKFSCSPLRLTANLGYDYLWARDLNKNRALKYRPRHLAYISVTFAPSYFQFGFDFRFMSRFEEIDRELIDLGLVKEGNLRGKTEVLDLRAGASLYQFNIPANVFLNINNVFNYNYIQMVGNVAPIRNISVNLEFLF